MNSAILSASDLTVTFGGVVALESVDLECQRGEITGLIGPNGAGKTTFIDAVTGFLPRHRAGRVTLDGVDVTKLPPHRLAHAGLARTWQGIELFDDLDVRANLEVAAGNLTFVKALRELLSPRRHFPVVEGYLEALGLAHLAGRRPEELSQGDRKVLGVARALAGEPKVLLLDEPAAGLDRHETQDFATGLKDLRTAGHSILLVDHDMGLVLSVCDRIHVLDFGRLIATGTPAEIRKDARVIHAYLGDSVGGPE